MAQTATTRRDLLRFGTSAAAYAAGAAIVTGSIALAGEAKGATIPEARWQRLCVDYEAARATWR